ncbi:MAG TPA: efflux RND transporter periplasmic adaptor subunit [Rhabdochlamydiaceae bacterium]|nr:efflux RND transporter periplasmic adaptor subunit [Rhabdochlamydiaceae bacterium]
MKKNILIVIVILALTAIIIVLIDRAYTEKKDINHITLYGNVDVRQVDIGFRVSGQVKQLLFEEGDKVSEGSLMCSMDDTPYDSQLKEASASAESVKANLENAEILLKRRLELIGIGAVSQEDLDNAEARRDQLISDLEAAEANIAIAKDNLSYTKAYAPTNGIILTRIREPGTVVNPADPVYTLSVSSPVWIRAYVNEPELGKVHYGMAAEVYTDTGRKYSGTVGFISPVAEFTPKTVESTQLRTDLVYRIRVYADNPDNQLVQGMPVTVKLNLK